MRGCANDFAIGDPDWQPTCEDHIVTPLQVLNVFQSGFVAYVDMAQIHRLSPSAWSPTYSDAGLDQRAGDTRNLFGNTIYFTIACPLESAPGVHGHEIVIGNVINFRQRISARPVGMENAFRRGDMTAHNGLVTAAGTSAIAVPAKYR